MPVETIEAAVPVPCPPKSYMIPKKLHFGSSGGSSVPFTAPILLLISEEFVIIPYTSSTCAPTIPAL